MEYFVVQCTRANASITAHKRNLESDLLRFCQEKGIEGIPNMDGLRNFCIFRNQDFLERFEHLGGHQEMLYGLPAPG